LINDHVTAITAHLEGVVKRSETESSRKIQAG